MARRSPLLKVHEVTPARWSDLERLFGAKGACAGCWCMFWRLEKGERFDDVKGATAKRRFKALIAKGEAHGVLAYAGDEPVGWCAFERRVELPKLDRAPSLRCDDAADVWSLPCFFVTKDWRGQGVARALLDGAMRALAKRKAKLAEGYPTLADGPVPPAFAYTGVPSLFEAAGFTCVEARPRGKQRYRRKIS